MKQVTRGLFVLLTLFMALTAMAKSKRYEVVLPVAVQAGGTHLKAGTYQMEVEGGTAIFYQGKKEICKVPVRAEEVDKTLLATSVERSSDNRLTSIEVGNTKMRLTVSQ